MATGALKPIIDLPEEGNNIIEVDFNRAVPALFSVEKMTNMVNNLREHLYLKGVARAANEINWWNVYKTLLPAGEECALDFMSVEYLRFFETANQQCPELLAELIPLLRQIVNLTGEEYIIPDTDFPNTIPDNERRQVESKQRMNMHQMNVLGYLVNRILTNRELPIVIEA